MKAYDLVTKVFCLCCPSCLMLPALAYLAAGLHG